MCNREDECPDCGMEIGPLCECTWDGLTGRVIVGGVECEDECVPAAQRAAHPDNG